MSKFDNTKPNVILISDHTDTLFMSKTFGPYKIARELRLVGYQVAVLHHAHIFSLDEIQEILDKLISDKTLFVGINNMFYKSFTNVSEDKKGGKTFGPRENGSILPHGKNKNFEIKSYIQALNPNCKLVLGGPMSYDGYENKDFDYLVLGYADLSIVNLANHLSIGELLVKSFKSIHGPIVINDPTAEGFNFINSRMSYEDYDCILPGETLPLETSRGCIFKCAFCAYPLNGKKKFDYMKNQDLIYEELMENYRRFNTTRYYFLDDTFNDSVEKVKMIYEVSKRLPFKLEYWAYIRLDLLAAHPETLDMIFESGLRAALFGIESLNEETCKAIGKGMKRDRFISTLKYIRDHWGDETMLHGTFIVGLPHETVETATETLELLISEDCPLDSWHVFPFYLELISKRTTEFASRIAKDPESFGYYNIKPIENIEYQYWENDHMNHNIADNLASTYLGRGENRKVDGFNSFQIASLGTDLAHSRNKPRSEFDWHSVELLKEKRAEEYKQRFYNAFDIRK